MVYLFFLVLIICKPVEKETFVNAVIAQSPQDIQRGLMFLKHPLPRDSGMLFDFGITKNNKIWMKNTFIPLDIIFLDENLRVLGFIENAEPLREKLLGIREKSRYVLEINGGWVENNQIKKGDRIDINKIKKFKRTVVN